MEDWTEDNLGDVLNDLNDLDALDDIDSDADTQVSGHHAAPPASARNLMSMDEIVRREAAMGMGGGSPTLGEISSDEDEAPSSVPRGVFVKGSPASALRQGMMANTQQSTRDSPPQGQTGLADSPPMMGASSDDDAEEEDMFPDASGMLRRIPSSFGAAGGASPSQKGSALTRADLFDDIAEEAAGHAALLQHAEPGMSPARPVPKPFQHNIPLTPDSDSEGGGYAADAPRRIPGRFMATDAGKYLSSMPATDGSLSIPITLPRGGRMFLQELEHPLTDAPPRAAALPSEDAAGSAQPSLLGAAGSALSVRQMLADIEATEASRTAARPGGDGGGALPAAPPVVNRSKVSSQGTKGSMWVDKYAPKKFLDLLSPDDVNRNVLRWVKLWDFKVFGKPVKNSAPPASSAGTAHGTKGGAYNGQRTLDRALGGGSSKADGGDRSGSKWGEKGEKGGKFGKWGDKKHKYDGPSRPGDGSFMGFGYGWRADSKVILLAGPPGLGKTTLAHIIARTAGYEPIEINASDERTASKVRERIQNAQQMTSLVSKGKPTLVVVDECDGMESAAVAEVVKMIKNTPSLVPSATSSAGAGDGKRGSKRGRDDEDATEGDDAEGGEGGGASGQKGGSGARGKRKQKTVAKLTRPVICICNDVYAPALRELRQLAQVVDLKRPSTEKLVERLSVICRKEDLLANRDALYELAAQSDNDVRSCLHTLQFLSQRLKSNASRISPDVVASAALGQKDSKSSLFDVWALTLTSASAAKRMPRVARAMARAGAADAATLAEFSKGGLSGGGGGSSGSKWAKAYARLLYSSYAALASEHRMLLAGLQENYTRTRCHDPSLFRGVAAADWLVFGDIVTQRGMSRSDFSLLRFLPVVAVGLHLAVASHSRVKTQFPRASGAARRAREQRAGILATFCQGRAVGIRGLPGTGASDRRATVLDVLPSFLSIVNPPLRSVTAALLTPKEKADAREAVAALLSCRCTYAPARKGAPTAVPGGGEDADPFAKMQWQLTPEVHYLCSFGPQGPFHPALRPALADPMRRLLAHEVRLALLRAGHDAAGHEAAAHSSDTPLKSSDSKAMPEHVKKIIAAGRSAAAARDGASPATVAAAAAAAVGGAGATPVKAAVAKAAADGTSLLATQGGDTPGSGAAPVDFTSPAATMVRIASWLQGGALGDGPVGDGAAAAAGRRKQARRSGNGERKRPRDKYPAYFQFQEGFTNAVRRPVYMQDVL